MFFITSFTEELCRPSDVLCKFRWVLQVGKYAAWHEGMSPVMVTVLVLISFRSKTIDACKREETFPPPRLSLLDGRLREKATHMPKCMLLFIPIIVC